MFKSTVLSPNFKCIKMADYYLDRTTNDMRANCFCHAQAFENSRKVEGCAMNCIMCTLVCVWTAVSWKSLSTNSHTITLLWLAGPAN